MAWKVKMVVGVLGVLISVGQAWALRPYVFYSSNGKHDKSFGQAAYRGVEKFRDDYKKIQAFYGLTAQLDERGLEGSNLSADLGMATRQVQQAISGGYDVIVVIGYTASIIFAKMAPEYPKVLFVSIDVPANPNLKNTVSFVFSEQEGGYMAGYLSAFLSPTNKVAAIGAMPIRPIKRYLCGYKRGVEGANVELKKKGKPEISFVGPVYMGNTQAVFGDVSKAKVLAKDLYDRGVGVIFAVAALASTAVLQESVEFSKASGFVTPRTRRLSIGVDSNQNGTAPGYVITSVIKRVEGPVYATLLLSALNKLGKLGGTINISGPRGFSLDKVLSKQPSFVRRYLGRMGVDITRDKYNRELIGTATYRRKIAALKYRLRSGKLKIENCNW